MNLANEKSLRDNVIELCNNTKAFGEDTSFEIKFALTNEGTRIDVNNLELIAARLRTEDRRKIVYEMVFISFPFRRYICEKSRTAKSYGQVVSNDGIKSDRSVLSEMGRRWPNGTVPYNIHPNASSLALEIKKAMDYIEKQTCVKFVKRNTETSFLYIIATENLQCSSYVGYFPNQYTRMSLNTKKCNNGKTIQHELLHALGFTHEHTRPDRDDYLKINWDNIKEDTYR
ncbi:unnamed protein product [Lepeophtheirus salmonis]|uniref:Metalloendopeptidase n=1 Tax=Lepeophtheirus salmonis TaxID=72036 RepID=A0A817FB74_LEPSM|nr:unnamed protein product [Lepeophtheirus salmonis]